MKEFTGAAESLKLYDFAENLLTRIVDEYEFPSHALLRVWGRRNTAMLSFTRQLYKWEASLMETHEVPSGLYVIQRHLNELTRSYLNRCWRGYTETPITSAFSFRRFYLAGKQFGRSIVVFDKPIFSDRLVWDGTWGRSLEQGMQYFSVDEDRIAGNEETLNLSFRRALKNQLGRGAQRSFVQIMDYRNYIFYASGLLSEGHQQISEDDDAARQSLRYVIERCFRNAMGEVFPAEKAENPPYIDVQFILSSDEAFGIVNL